MSLVTGGMQMRTTGTSLGPANIKRLTSGGGQWRGQTDARLLLMATQNRPWAAAGILATSGKAESPNAAASLSPLLGIYLQQVNAYVLQRLASSVHRGHLCLVAGAGKLGGWRAAEPMSARGAAAAPAPSSTRISKSEPSGEVRTNESRHEVIPCTSILEHSIGADRARGWKRGSKGSPGAWGTFGDGLDCADGSTRACKSELITRRELNVQLMSVDHHSRKSRGRRTERGRKRENLVFSQQMRC